MAHEVATFPEVKRPVAEQNKKKKGLGSMRRKEAMAGYLFLLPNLIGFLTFSIFPILAAIYLTFTKWDLASTPKLTGLDNFWQMASDELFWKSLLNTFYYASVAVPTGVFVAFWLALLVNRPMRGVFAFRLIYFLPHVTLTVAAAIVW